MSISTQALARACARHPRRVFAAWGVALLVAMAAIATLLGSALTTDQEITANPESKRALTLLDENFPDRQTVDEVIVVRTADGSVDDEQFREAVDDLRSDIAATGAVAETVDPFAAEERSVSADRQAVVIPVLMGPDGDEGIADVLDVVQDADGRDGVDVTITGEHTLGHDFNELSARDLEKGELQIGLPAALVVLLLVFGAVVAAVIPMAMAIVSIIAAVGISAVVGQLFELSLFVVNMITAMGLALGIDYTLFVLSRFREERSAGVERIEAVAAAGGTASKAVLFSGSAFVVALSGLLLVPDTILRSLAFGAIVVGVVTVVAALTLLPALLAVLGDRVNWLRLPVVGRGSGGESRFWTRAVRAVVRRPATALVLSVLVLLALALPVLDLSTGNAGVSTLPDRTFSKQGFLALERNFPGAASADPARVVVAGALFSPDVDAAMDRLESAVADDGDFGPAQRQVAPNGELAVWSFPLPGDPNGDRARAAVDRLRADIIPAAFAGTDAEVLVTGTTAFNVDYTNLIDQWLPIVLAFVLGLSLLLLLAVFRSLVLAVTAVLLNLLSVGAAYGLLVLVFQKGYGAGVLGFQQVERVEAWVPVFLFSVLFALSMDYHVFLLSRIRERYVATRDTVDAVVHGIASTGRIITGAALIIVAVFAGFATGDLVMFQQMGFGVGVALLLDATLIRTVLVPAVMTLLGRWNWYLPSWLGWLPELHVEGDRTPASAVPGDGRLPGGAVPEQAGAQHERSRR